MTHKRALKFLTVLDSCGPFRFINKQSLNANVHFFKKSKILHLYNYVSTKISGVSRISHGSL